MDIKKPFAKKPQDVEPSSGSELEMQPLDDEPQVLKSKKRLSLVQRILLVIGSLLVLCVVLVVSAYLWYKQALTAVDPSDASHIGIVIQPGTGPSQIGDLLAENGLIRSSLAFDIYTREKGVRGNLQAGNYSLSPSDDLATIVEQLQNAQADTFNVTLYPGGRLFDNSDKPVAEKHDVRTALVRAGFSSQEIEQALTADYTSHPLLKSKPKDADLEGYIYGDTYNLPVGSSAQEVLRRAMDEMYAVITDLELETAFAKQGLNLYEAITLASIVQAEVPSSDDQRQAAQVFLKRLEIGMLLGSDVTYQYIADKLGVPRDYNLDNPYNTRKYGGLPPGPISNPGKSALQAVANPAEGDYLYFVAGEDGKTYFARTNEEHEQNVRDHCGDLCLVP